MSGTKLKAGDRVAVYGYGGRAAGLGSFHCTVICVSTGLPCGSWVTVQMPIGNHIEVHSKQCRKLKPRKKFRVFIDRSELEKAFAKNDGVRAYPNSWEDAEFDFDWIEFVEVNRGKT